MKIVIIAASVAVASLQGCASLRSPETAYVDNTDYARMAAVDNVARTNGVAVLWINAPEKKDKPVGVAPALGEPAGT